VEIGAHDKALQLSQGWIPARSLLPFVSKITVGEELDADRDEAFQDPVTVNLVKQVSTKTPFHVASFGDLHIALLNFGVLEDIVRSLSLQGASVIM